MSNSYKYLAIAVILSVMLLSGCSDDLTNIGIAIQPEADGIDVFSDTFIVESDNWMIPAISAQADTMVLGCFYSPLYGATKAELLLQFSAPDDYTFPSEEYNPTPDSLALLFYYSSYTGSPYSPLQFTVYEMNKEDINYTDRYYSNLDPMQYSDTTILMGQRVFTTIDLSRRNSESEDSASTPYVRYKFNDTQVNRFFDMVKSDQTITTEEFLKKFKGIYVTTTYGSSTMTYINQATLYLYYHYTYKRDGHDTIVKTSIAFPANHEVRQLNRFTHPDRETIVSSIPDSLLYIKSAAGIYPRIRIPFNRIYARAKANGANSDNKIFNISAAELELECIDDEDNEDEYTPVPSAIMAISTSSLDDYMKHNTIITGYEDDRVLAYLKSSTNSYNFDFSYLLTKAMQNDNINPDSVFEFVLVPMNVEYVSSTSGTTSVNSMRPMVKLAATRVRSHKNSYSPLRLKILYEGY